MSKERSKVLVTGGCGFIGTWVLRDLLGRGAEAVVLDYGDRPERWRRVIGDACESIPLVRGNLLDRKLLADLFERHEITHVIHLAAVLTPGCQNDPWEGCQINVQGSVALLEEIRRRVDRIRGFAYASSVAVFGDEPDHSSGGETHGTLPMSFYGAFKKSLELITDQYWRHFRIPSVGIRPQVAYGPERELGLTAGPSLAARAAVRGERYRIAYSGRVGYDYVEDVARAFVRSALETPSGAHVVDLPGEFADTTDVVEAILHAVPEARGSITADGPPIPAGEPPRPHFISTLYPDWKTMPLREGIRRTVDFYRQKQPTH
ncbi:MAG: NAD(P)-dependent oxidoreductase [Verrucomicrobia bacterium]|nr:NAD(P)-dependent oxidoreductase [Verrucomicrobiota bacterium]